MRKPIQRLDGLHKRLTSKNGMSHMAKNDHLPKYNELLNPLLQALHDLGGSVTIGEISSKVSELYLCHIQGIKGANGD